MERPTEIRRENWRNILFDFDGTVFDTVEGITKSIQFALNQHGIQADLEELRCFAGPPLVDKFVEVYNVARKEAEQLVVDFRKRYVPIGIYESKPFAGIREVLQTLKERGFHLALATSKPQEMAELLLDRSGLIKYFDAIAGSGVTINNQQKWEIVLRAMEQLSAEAGETVLVGDTRYDVEGAAKCGIPCIGAGWGYAAEGELQTAGALTVLPRPADLITYLLQNG